MARTACSMSIGVIGAVICRIMGNVTPELVTLIIIMGVDILTALIVAGMGKSQKSDSGGISSKSMINGILKKALYFVLIIIAYQLDNIANTNTVRAAVIIALCFNDIVSILENISLTGIPVPTVITDMLDVFKNKKESEE